MDMPEKIKAWNWNGKTHSGQWHINPQGETTEYTRSDLAVEVKPLEWDDYRGGGAKAPSLMLASYLITQWVDDQFELVESAPGYQGQRIGDGLFPSLEEAKAAAQADHKARVRSELILRPDDLRPKLQALLSKWEGMTCRTKCAQELREVLEGGT